MKKAFLLVVITALLITACSSPHTAELATKTSQNTDETPTPIVSIVSSATTPQPLPIPPITTPTPPIEYSKYQIEGGPTIEVWSMKDETSLMAAMPSLVLISAADGPLPFGEILAIALIAGTIYYLVEADVNLVPDLPAIPQIDWQGAMHATKRRGWMIMFTTIVYWYVRESPDAVYYGPSSGRLILVRNDPYWGIIGLIFSAEQNIRPDENHIISGGLITIIYDRSRKLERIRMSDCASWQIFPVIGYNSIFEPPPAGSGRCFANGNITPP
jgi:hypothetical protein